MDFSLANKIYMTNTISEIKQNDYNQIIYYNYNKKATLLKIVLSTKKI